MNTEYEPPTPSDTQDFEENFCSNCGEEIETEGLEMCKNCEENDLIGDEYGGF
jgi:RNA polymerase subunit RPABC4/transcription elongation factor Spt4